VTAPTEPPRGTFRRRVEGWPAINLVTLWLCDDCLDGKGGECHTPGCAMWLNRAPDLELRSKLVLP